MYIYRKKQRDLRFNPIKNGARKRKISNSFNTTKKWCKKERELKFNTDTLKIRVRGRERGYLGELEQGISRTGL